MKALIIVLVAQGILAGCASLDSIHVSKRLDGGRFGMANAVSLDAKQRAVYSQRVKTTTGTGSNKVTTRRVIVCAEPSPDALTALGASGALSGNDPKSGVALNSAMSLAEAAGSIGLRTQSIQLLRDSMYRDCEAYNAGGIDQTTYEELRRRNQSTMLGLLAIEQLTGPVTAAQLALASGTNAKSGVLEDSAAMDKLHAREDEANKALLDAQTAEAASKAELEKARQAREKADKALADAAGDPNHDKEDIKALQSTADQRADDYRAASLKADQAALAVQSAKSAAADAKQELAAARNSAATGATTEAQLQAIKEVAKSSTEKLGGDIFNIVTEINNSYSREKCLGLMDHIIRVEADQKKWEKLLAEGVDIPKVLDTTITICKKLFENVGSGAGTHG